MACIKSRRIGLSLYLQLIFNQIHSCSQFLTIAGCYFVRDKCILDINFIPDKKMTIVPCNNVLL